MKKHLKKIVLLLIFFIIALVIYSVFFKHSEEIEYLTETVKTGSIRKSVNATGEISPVQLVNVGAQVSGQITKLYVVLGQKINKGDKIADIDSTTQLNELNTNKAKLETYKAQLNSAQVALTVAQSKYNRETSLMAKDATSKQNYEDAKNALASANANIAELKSTIKQAQISVNTSEVNLGYTKIISPLEGTVVSIPIEEGQTVNSYQTAPTIVQVADLSEMQIKLQISEGDVTKVKPGMKVTYTILSEPDRVYETTLRSVDPGLTTLTNGSYSGSTDANTAIYYYGKLVVPNENNMLHIGMTTQNTIIVEEKNDVLILPSLTIHQKNDKKMVYVLENGNSVVEKTIETGLSDSMNTEVVSGLKSGEKVVSAQMVNGQQSTNVRMRSGRGGIRI